MKIRITPFDWAFIVSVPIILLLSALLHYLYDWAPSSATAIFAPTDESVFQHLKILYYPILLWWIVAGIFFRRGTESSSASRLFGVTISCLTACLMLPALYYLCICGFGMEHSFVIALLLEAVAIITAQAFGYYAARNLNSGKIVAIICMVILIGLAVMLALFTFYPLDLPIFKLSSC